VKKKLYFNIVIKNLKLAVKYIYIYMYIYSIE